MKNLPTLIKDDDKYCDYRIAVETVFNKERDKEIFSFCIIARYKYDTDSIVVLQHSTVINDFIGIIHSPIKEYKTQLRNFYNAHVYEEKEEKEKKEKQRL